MRSIRQTFAPGDVTIRMRAVSLMQRNWDKGRRNTGCPKNRLQHRSPWLTEDESLTSSVRVNGELDMKKTYEKPVLLKKDRLSAVTAGNGGSAPPPQ
ncbi:hypothetical protein MesoLj131a_43420 [Mesorhizobium sp. 131-2-1]|nr:hypothetical protein MesoLj131a_43420 [Mesorhizobium sp. 131-2-1]